MDHMIIVTRYVFCRVSEATANAFSVLLGVIHSLKCRHYLCYRQDWHCTFRWCRYCTIYH